MLTVLFAITLSAVLIAPLAVRRGRGQRQWLVICVLASGAVIALVLNASAPPGEPLSQRIAALKTKPAEAMTLDEAGVILAERVKTAPDDAAAWSFLAQVRADQGRDAEALNARREAWRLDPSPLRQFEFAGALVQAEGGEISDEIAGLYQSLVLNSDTPPALREASRFALGERAWRQGEEARALQYWTQALGNVPANSEMHLELALRGFDLVGMPSAGPDLSRPDLNSPDMNSPEWAAMPDPAEMVARLRARLDANETEPRLWMQAIRAEWSLGNRDEARRLMAIAKEKVREAPFSEFLAAAEWVIDPRSTANGESP